MNTIAIIGGGASGILLATQLIRQYKTQKKALFLWIIEPADLGTGLAYSTTDMGHLLNVPVGRMSGLAEDMQHCYEWLKKRKSNPHPNDFIPRKQYKQYLNDLFAETTALCDTQIQWAQLRSKASDADWDGKNWHIKIADNQTIVAQKIVLALGHSQPAAVPTPDTAYQRHLAYKPNPWGSRALKDIDKKETIFLIGSGLTAVDGIISLFHAGHQGKIYALSPQGLKPNVHRFGTPVYPSFFEELKRNKHPLEMLKIVRKHLEKAARHEYHWQAVIDSLRPNNQEIWQLWSEEERAAFLRHLAPHWNVARHRIAPEIEPILQTLEQRDQLHFLAGRIEQIHVSSDTELEVLYKPRGSQQSQSLSVSRLVNCTGPNTDFSQLDLPFINNMMRKGWIRQDALRLGLDGTTHNLQLLAADGNACPNAYFIGPLSKSIFWESIAIPEIRQQAKQLATELCGTRKQEASSY